MDESFLLVDWVLHISVQGLHLCLTQKLLNLNAIELLLTLLLRLLNNLCQFRYLSLKFLSVDAF